MPADPTPVPAPVPAAEDQPVDPVPSESEVTPAAEDPGDNVDPAPQTEEPGDVTDPVTPGVDPAETTPGAEEPGEAEVADPTAGPEEPGDDAEPTPADETAEPTPAGETAEPTPAGETAEPTPGEEDPGAEVSPTPDPEGPDTVVTPIPIEEEPISTPTVTPTGTPTPTPTPTATPTPSPTPTVILGYTTSMVSNLHAGKEFYLNSLKNTYHLTFSDDFADIMDSIEADYLKSEKVKDTSAEGLLARNWQDVLAVYVYEENHAGNDSYTLDNNAKGDLSRIFAMLNPISGKGKDASYANYHVNYYIREKQIVKEDRELLKKYTETDCKLLCATVTAAKGFVRQSVGDNVSEERVDVISAAYSLVGKVGYFWGGKSTVIGEDPSWGSVSTVTADGSNSTGTLRAYGLDCSGFVTWAVINGYKDKGMQDSIGDGTSSQWNNAKVVSEADAQPGDLVFQSGPEAGQNNHVGILVGKTDAGDWIAVHCSSSQNGVTVGEAYSASFRYIREPLFYPEKEEPLDVMEEENIDDIVVDTENTADLLGNDDFMDIILPSDIKDNTNDSLVIFDKSDEESEKEENRIYDPEAGEDNADGESLIVFDKPDGEDGDELIVFDEPEIEDQIVQIVIEEPGSEGSGNNLVVFDEPEDGSDRTVSDEPEDEDGSDLIVFDRPEKEDGSDLIVFDEPEGEDGSDLIVFDEPEGEDDSDLITFDRPEGEQESERSDTDGTEEEAGSSRLVSDRPETDNGNGLIVFDEPAEEDEGRVVDADGSEDEKKQSASPDSGKTEDEDLSFLDEPDEDEKIIDLINLDDLDEEDVDEPSSDDDSEDMTVSEESSETAADDSDAGLRILDEADVLSDISADLSEISGPEEDLDMMTGSVGSLLRIHNADEDQASSDFTAGENPDSPEVGESAEDLDGQEDEQDVNVQLIDILSTLNDSDELAENEQHDADPGDTDGEGDDFTDGTEKVSKDEEESFTSGSPVRIRKKASVTVTPTPTAMPLSENSDFTSQIV